MFIKLNILLFIGISTVRCSIFCLFDLKLLFTLFIYFLLYTVKQWCTSGVNNWGQPLAYQPIHMLTVQVRSNCERWFSQLSHHHFDSSSLIYREQDTFLPSPFLISIHLFNGRPVKRVEPHSHCLALIPFPMAYHKNQLDGNNV